VKLLAKEHQGVTLALSGANWTVTGGSSFGGWREYLTSNVFISDNYFDLAGIAMDDKTLFFESAGVQIIKEPMVTANPTPGDELLVTDIMSTTSLTDAELIAVSAYGNLAGNTSPGLTWAETVYARNQTWSITQDQGPLGSMRLYNEHFFGSMQPTASDRIYSYRVIAPVAQGMTGMFISGARHMLSAEPKTEEEYVYLMRLKRAYQLQQSYDED
jgi:hypothetical protein